MSGLSPNLSCADYVVDPETGCWNWQRFRDPNRGGYGQVKHGRAHRLYYERYVGPIPEGYDIHHKCENTACVNPEHLEALSAREHDVKHFLEGRTGLTLDDLREMREMGRQRGVSLGEIVKRFGVVEATVVRILEGHRWPDLLGGGRAAPEMSCVVCGGEATGRRDKQYCSGRCKSKARNARAKARRNA